ncbi:GNAT family N-acetyltransferase [Paenibacillus ginsengarvi]|uniref:GNAT family N-acetyltransferase n=1 Tax=Paenibacillus ginsengarvi TaxID=400777 RepID=A0A3B0CCN6_9BACL|nr:GNAT family N-acetyltransferase [Paenibacillus ginsengarvi]RKN81939.1 GNAT family N-acetyltransferase [Paenibacillus ginsengarvi]
MGIQYKTVSDVETLLETVELQKRVWSADSVTSMHQMMAATHHGGVVIAAFDADQVVGFVYGFPAYDGVKPYLFSHMMAIDPDYRDAGLGSSLKIRQREWAIGNGYDKIAWTYDPLETRNGYLNLNKLGGAVRTYYLNYYGHMNDVLNASLPTDRFLLEWELQSAKCKDASQGIAIDSSAWAAAPHWCEWEMESAFPRPRPRMQAESQQHSPKPQELTESTYLVPVPKAIRELKLERMELALEWRLLLRSSMMQAFSSGYRAVGLWRTEQPVHYYVITKS